MLQGAFEIEEHQRAACRTSFQSAVGRPELASKAQILRPRCASVLTFLDSRAPGAMRRAAECAAPGLAPILSDQWPEKIGKGLIFISLNAEPQTIEAEIAALDALHAEFEAKGVVVKEGWWGYRLLVVEDPGGN